MRLSRTAAVARPKGSTPRGVLTTPVLVLVALVALLLFCGLAAAVATAQTLGFDSVVRNFVGSLRSAWLTDAMLFVTYTCTWQVVVFGVGVVAVLLGLIRRWLTAAMIVVGSIGDEIISSALKLAFHRPRPDQSLALLPAHGGSFPSGHTLIAVSFYGLVSVIVIENLPRQWLRFVVSVLAILFILTVGYSRIYLGAHWPSDVVGSFALGSAWVSLLLMALTRVQAAAGHVGQRAFPITAAIAGLAIWLAFVLVWTYVHPLPSDLV